MATKIINVLKDDKFKDIIGIFKNTPAEEVIFVLPKNPKVLAVEQHFVELSEAVRESEKSVLILTSKPEISSMALKYGFGVLTSERKEPKPKKQTSKEELSDVSEEKMVLEEQSEPSVEALEEGQTDDIETREPSVKEDDESSHILDDGGLPTVFQENKSEFPDVELAAVKRQSKSMSDIISPADQEEEVKLNVSKKTEKPLNLNIKRESIEEKRLEDIESVWQARPTSGAGKLKSRPTIPPKINSPSRFKLPSFNLKRKTITLFGSAVIILFVVVVYISTGSANVIVKPRPHAIDLSMKVTSSDQVLEVDLGLKKIPGQLFSINKKVEDTFQATGERDVAQKAKGKVTVYNEYGTTPQVLIATTRLESQQGFIFRTLKTVTVPGTTVKNGKITPGSIEVEVIADKAGEAYNLEASKFTIPAFREKGDSDRYQKFYGVSQEPMKGGIVGKAKVVTDQDYINAKEAVSKKLLSEINQDLNNQAAGLKMLSPSQPSVQETTSTAQPDEAVDSFVVSQTAEVKSVGFKEADLHELIRQYISDINNLMILPEKLELEFKDVNFNKEKNALEFTVLVKGPAYSQIDKDKLIKDLIGKNEKDITEYIKSIEGISSARVTLSPFWVRKVPVNRDKIRFEFQYD